MKTNQINKLKTMGRLRLLLIKLYFYMINLIEVSNNTGFTIFMSEYPLILAI